MTAVIAEVDRCPLCWDNTPPNFETPSGQLAHDDCYRQHEADNNGDGGLL